MCDSGGLKNDSNLIQSSAITKRDELSSSPPTTKNSEGTNSSMTTHRLFLSQVNQTIDRSTLVQGISKVFETYGEVVEVFVPERSKKAYAFVTLESYNPDAAQRAAAELGRKEKSQDVELFQGIQPAQAMRNQKQLKLDQEWKRKFELASKSNIICQVHTSHVERLIDYVSNTTDKNLPESIKVSIMGSLSSTNTMSLVFLGVLPQPKVFVEWLESIWFVICRFR